MSETPDLFAHVRDAISQIQRRLQAAEHINEGYRALEEEFDKVRRERDEALERVSQIETSLKVELTRVKEERAAIEFDYNTAKADVEQLKAELASILRPILGDDGQGLGQVFAKKYDLNWDLIFQTDQDKIEAAAQATVAAARPAIEAECLAQAIRRMEAVLVKEMWDAYNSACTSYGGMNAVRARFIAAVSQGAGGCPSRNPLA